MCINKRIPINHSWMGWWAVVMRMARIKKETSRIQDEVLALNAGVVCGAMFEDSFVNSDGFWMLQELLALDEASQGVYA